MTCTVRQDKGRQHLRLACFGMMLACAGLVTSATPARADFFDDARQGLTQDVPHFFQDDIPCAFGGQPTSGTKPTCNSPKPPPPPPVERRSGNVEPLPPPPPRQPAPVITEPLPPPPPALAPANQ